MATGNLVLDSGGGRVSYSRSSMEVPQRSLVQSLSPLRLIDGLPRRRSLSYNRMPVEPIKLSILKLDGSSFDVEVLKTATVGELKMAVESLFSHTPNKGPGKISWPHVWGNFCLCYEGHKLVMETDYLCNFGIKDGDQLHFIRHISNDYTLLKKQKKTRVSSSKQPKLSLSKHDPQKKEEKKFQEDRIETITKSQHSLIVRNMRGWLSHTILSYRGGAKHRATTTSSSSSSSSYHGGSSRGLKEIVTMFRFRCYSEKDVWNRSLISRA